MKKRGAPTKKDEDVIAKILSIINLGIEKKIACQACGVAPSTWWRWVQADSELADRESQAQARAIVQTVSVIHNAAVEDWRAGAWKAEKLWPKIFGSRASLTVDANFTSGHDYSKLSLEEKEALRSLLIKAKPGSADD